MGEWICGKKSKRDCYIKPTVKTRTTPTFRRYVVFRFQTAWIGMNRMMKSVRVLQMPLASSRSGILIHLPGTDLFHILSRGVHSHIFTTVVAK